MINNQDDMSNLDRLYDEIETKYQTEKFKIISMHANDKISLNKKYENAEQKRILLARSLIIIKACLIV
jgi:hypothetical protein